MIYAPYADSNLGKHKVPTLRNVGLGSCEARGDWPDCPPGIASPRPTCTTATSRA